MVNHELPAAFEQHRLPLHSTLVEMLDEHHSHRTERRGCGFTQATRFLADLVNRPVGDSQRGRGLFDSPAIDVSAKLFWQEYEGIQSDLRQPESRLLLAIMADLLKPDCRPASCFPVAAEKLKVGSCPLAEQYFLEIAHGRVRRGGRVNVFVDELGVALLLEKRGLGDEHSCISVGKISFNGIELPAGSLFAIDYSDDALEGQVKLKTMPGHCLPFSLVRSGRFLRLTTLAVAPNDRARTFSAHFQQQIDGGLFSPDTTTIEMLAHVARNSLP